MQNFDKVIEELRSIASDGNAVPINNAIMLITQLKASNKSLLHAYEDVAARLQSYALTDALTSKPSTVNVVMGWSSLYESNMIIKVFADEAKADEFVKYVESGNVKLADVDEANFAEDDVFAHTVKLPVE